MPKIGEMTELGVFKAGVFVPGFDSTDPANPDVKIPMSLFTGVVDASADHTTAKNIGTVPALVTAVERGDGSRHKTILTLAAAAVGTSGDAAAKGTGGLIYTFPAGVIVVRAAMLAVGVAIADAVKTDNPLIGLGTVVAAGVVSVLSGTATFENIFAGANIADVNGTVYTGVKLPTASPFALVILAGDPHTVYMNFADTWANLTGEAALTATGTVVLEWDFLSA